MKLRFQNTYARLPERFFERRVPTPVAQPALLYWNKKLSEELGMDLDFSSEEERASVFSGNHVPEGAEPLAQAYAGHQFAHFVPQLGDGRALLLGEIAAPNGKLWDLQLKGSGPTRFSRRGDGRAALGPMMRECVVSEGLHALGIPTTRSLALVASGEGVLRETLLPGAILTRVASSHVRVGTFEYFSAQKDWEAVETLANFVIDRHYPHVRSASSPLLALLEEVIRTQAELIARWLQVGFIHGVMNTDNMALSGESIDFGPCAFMDAFDPNAVFSSIDQKGRYAYQQQPTIALWNLTRLAECFLPLLDPSPERAKALALDALSRFDDVFQSAYLTGFGKKIGLSDTSPKDAALVETWLGLLARHKVDFTLGFLALSEPETLAELFPGDPSFGIWFETWTHRLQSQGLPDQILKANLATANPILIPRNHQIERAIVEAYTKADLQVFYELMEAVQRPFEKPHEKHKDLILAPRIEEQVTATFCGT